MTQNPKKDKNAKNPNAAILYKIAKNQKCKFLHFEP
jgi:hypothetical protein